MENACSVLYNLPIFALLPKEVKDVIIKSFALVSYSFGQTIVQEGEPADAFYILASGRARVVKMDSHGEEISLYLLRPGDTFGEMGLLSQTEKKRTATVRASSDVLVYRLDSSIFQALIQTNPEIAEYFELQIKYRNLHNFFLEYTPFSKLPIAAIKTMLSESKEIDVDHGEFVIRQGDEPGPMYIIEDGKLRVFTENGHRIYRAYLRKGDFFGELSMLKGIKRSASVQAHTPCKLLMLMRESFNMMIDSYPEFIAKIEEKISEYDYRQIKTMPLDFNEDCFSNDIEKQDTPVLLNEEQEEEFSSTSLSTSLGPFASPEGYFIKRKKKRIKNLPYIWQGDETDSGAACLTMVCRYFGNYISLSHIRQLVYTGVEGTNLRALCHAAKELGLEARSIKASKRHLMKIPLPAIVQWKGDHWVVLYDVDKKNVSIADPAVGLQEINRREFEKNWTGCGAIFDYTQKSEKVSEGKSILHWLWPFLRPFKLAMLKVIGLTFIISMFQMALPVFIQIVLDKAIVGQNMGLLFIFILSMLAALFFIFIATGIQRYLLSFTAVHIDISAMDFIIQRILSLPMSYFNMRRRLNLRERLERIKPLLDCLAKDGIHVLTHGIQLILAFILMIYYSKILGLIFLAFSPIYLFVVKFAGQHLKLGFNVIEDFFRKFHSAQIDMIEGIETVKAIGAEDALRKKMLNRFQNISQPLVKTRFNLMGYDGIIQIVVFFNMALFWCVGAYQVMNGRLTIGSLVAFCFLGTFANESIRVLLSVWKNVQSASGISDKLCDIFEQESEQGIDHSHLKPVRTLEGRIRFQNVSFRYHGPDSPDILQDISFEVPPGKTVAVTGRNSSGKTTLIKCLSGLLEPTGGTIFYDNIDQKKINHKDLRRHFGVVLSENHIFNGTIASNIALGEKEPDMDKVLWAARLSNVHVFIENLPLGYDTRVGQTGIILSASQQQCIAIARAIYHRPSILIFDNATCYLDRDSEMVFRENIRKLREGRTCFFIDNCLANIKDADIILVMEKGKLIEQGKHDELIKRKGTYYDLYDQELKILEYKQQRSSAHA